MDKKVNIFNNRPSKFRKKNEINIDNKNLDASS